MKKSISLLIALGLFASPALAFAQGVRVKTDVRAQVTASTTGSAKVMVRVNDRISQAKSRAADEIERRIKSLDKLDARIADMRRLTDSSQVSLQASITAQIRALQALEVKINSNTSTTTLKEDINSVTKSYRVYALILPKISVTASADRVLFTADQLSALADKLETRIASSTAATTTVTGTTTVEMTLVDMKAKIADAKVQANAALSLIANLEPDNGDKAVIEANRKAFMDARSKIRVAHKDLQDARKDAGLIVRALKKKK